MINKEFKTPQDYYKDGKACPGNYHLNYSYGGVALYQNVITGGERDVFRCGFVPKRELFNLMHAYLSGARDYESSNNTL